MKYLRVLLLALLLVAMTVIFFSQVASAHNCTSSDPANACGNCKVGAHAHTFLTGIIFCASGKGDPGGITDVSVDFPEGIGTGGELVAK